MNKFNIICLKKNSNVTPVFEKHKEAKENHCPLRILPVISKIIKKLLSKQITNSVIMDFENFLAPKTAY